MKIPFGPEVQSYSVAEGEWRSVAGQLRTPVPELGAGTPNTAYSVSCRFNLATTELDTLASFLWAHASGQVFEADLIIDGPVMKEYSCKWDCTTWRVSNAGLAYYVDMTMLAMEQ